MTDAENSDVERQQRASQILAADSQHSYPVSSRRYDDQDLGLANAIPSCRDVVFSQSCDNSGRYQTSTDANGLASVSSEYTTARPARQRKSTSYSRQLLSDERLVVDPNPGTAQLYGSDRVGSDRGIYDDGWRSTTPPPMPPPSPTGGHERNI